VPGSDGSRHVLASELLDAIAKALATMPDSPQKRQIRAKADTYRRTIDQFRTSRITAAQREALDEMVLALHGKLLEVLRRTSPLIDDAARAREAPRCSRAARQAIGHRGRALEEAGEGEETARITDDPRAPRDPGPPAIHRIGAKRGDSPRQSRSRASRPRSFAALHAGRRPLPRPLAGYGP